MNIVMPDTKFLIYGPVSPFKVVKKKSRIIIEK